VSVLVAFWAACLVALALLARLPVVLAAAVGAAAVGAAAEEAAAVGAAAEEAVPPVPLAAGEAAARELAAAVASAAGEVTAGEVTAGDPATVAGGAAMLPTLDIQFMSQVGSMSTPLYLTTRTGSGTGKRLIHAVYARISASAASTSPL